jgi:flagellar basal-body rod modification protein FlgD
MSSIALHPMAANAAASAQTSQQSGVVSSNSASTDQNMFLQLLVSELQNQDPMNPVQGTDFVTQLAQFQQLEQSVNTGENVTAIRADLDQLIAAGQSTTGSTQPTTQS